MKALAILASYSIFLGFSHVNTLLNFVLILSCISVYVEGRGNVFLPHTLTPLVRVCIFVQQRHKCLVSAGEDNPVG